MNHFQIMHQPKQGDIFWTVKFKNQRQQITLYYEGNYQKDCDAGNLDYDRLLITIKPVGKLAEPLFAAKQNIYVQSGADMLASPAEIDRKIQKLTLAKQDIRTIKQLINTWFPHYQ